MERPLEGFRDEGRPETVHPLRQKKPLTEFRFRKRGGTSRSSWCKPCSTAYRRQWRRLNPDRARIHNRSNYRRHERPLPLRPPTKTLRPDDGSVGRALGVIHRKDACEHCGTPATQARLLGHHPDYAAPLKVIWLCPRCHANVHWGKARDLRLEPRGLKPQALSLKPASNHLRSCQ